MPRLLTRCTLFAGALSAGIVAAQAQTSTPEPFKEASVTFETGLDGRADANAAPRNDRAATLVVGHDGDQYNALAGSVTARFRLEAKVKAGHRIYGWVLTTGDPNLRALLTEDGLGAGTIGNSENVRTRKLDETVTFTMDPAVAANTGFGGGGISLTRVQDMITACNNRFSEPPEDDEIIDQRQMTVRAGFAAGKRSASTGGPGYDFGMDTNGIWYDQNATGNPAIAETTFPVNIVCAGEDFRSADAPNPPRAGNELYSVDLMVDQHGQSCPKDVTVTAYADYRWPATSAMRMQVNGGYTRTRFAKTRKVTFAGKTFHRAERQFKYKLDPGQRSFTLTVDGKNGKTRTKTVEIQCPAFKVTSAWLDYKVEDTPDCPMKVTETATFHTTRPGWVKHEIRMKGGLVVSSGKLTSKRKGNTYVATAVRQLTMNEIDSEFMADAIGQSANSGWVPLKTECPGVGGEISVYNSVLKPLTRCPRKGRATFTITSGSSKPVDYRVDCTGGRSWQGTMQMSATGSGMFAGTQTKTFDVTKTELVSCVLKRVKGIQSFVLNIGAEQFSCANRTVEPVGMDFKVERDHDRIRIDPSTLVTPVPPSITPPGRTPPVSVTPVPERPQRTGGSDVTVNHSSFSFCDGGHVKDGMCICRKGWTPKVERKLDHGTKVWGYKCIPGASDDKTTRGENPGQQRIDALNILKQKAEAERLRKAKIAAEKRRQEALKIARKKAQAERLRKAKIAAQKAAERKRLQEAAQRARVLKLQRERAKRAARAGANTRVRAHKRKRSNVKVAPGRRATTPQPVVNQRRIRTR